MRPTTVRCGSCDTDAPARTAREAVLSWPLSASGAGTMSDPQRLSRLNVWVCGACWKASENPGTVLPTIPIRESVLSSLVAAWSHELVEPEALF